eukprot:scaffold6224_cov203-Alexandrium_tamarense.AAC.5
MDLLCTFRRSSLYIRTAQSELTNSDFVPIRTYIFGSELVNWDLAVRVDQIGSDLIESDLNCPPADPNQLLESRQEIRWQFVGRIELRTVVYGQGSLAPAAGFELSSIFAKQLLHGLHSKDFLSVASEDFLFVAREDFSFVASEDFLF